MKVLEKYCGDLTRNMEVENMGEKESQRLNLGHDCREKTRMGDRVANRDCAEDSRIFLNRQGCSSKAVGEHFTCGMYRYWGQWDGGYRSSAKTEVVAESLYSMVAVRITLKLHFTVKWDGRATGHRLQMIWIGDLEKWIKMM